MPTLTNPPGYWLCSPLYLALINYCIRIWGTTNTTIIKKVQKLQNFAAKLAMGGARKFDHVTPIMQKLRWMKIQEKYKLDTCTAVFKILNGYYPIWYKKFLTVHEVTNSSTRQRNCLYVPKTRTDTGARSFNVTGSKTWNTLPQDVTSVASLSLFKSPLTSHLLK